MPPRCSCSASIKACSGWLRPKGWSHLPAGRGCGFPGRRRGVPARGIRPAPKPGTGHASPADGGGHLRARGRITRPGGTPAACRCPPPLLRMAGHRVCSPLIGDPSRTGRQFPAPVRLGTGSEMSVGRSGLFTPPGTSIRSAAVPPPNLHRDNAVRRCPRPCSRSLARLRRSIPSPPRSARRGERAAAPAPANGASCAVTATNSSGRTRPGGRRVPRGSRKPPRRGCGPAGRRRAQRPHRLRHRTRAAFEGVPRYDPDIPEAAAFGIVTHGAARRGLPGRIGFKGRISVVETGKGRLPCRA